MIMPEAPGAGSAAVQRAYLPLRLLTLTHIRRLYERGGHRMYSGEPVTQLEHALQTACLAEEAGAGPALVTASFLHDLGHLLNDQGETPTERGIDDHHQFFALPYLRRLFGDDVLQPIKLHVDAKRYLCTTRAGYRDALSADSRRSLALQGGAFDEAACAAFAARPGAHDAVRLRVWDDAAKVAGRRTPGLGHYVALMAQVTAARRGT